MTDRDAMMMSIAKEVHAARPAWDISGILAALKKIPADRDPEWIRAAALAAAKNRIIRWPAVIPLDGDHWETTKRRIQRPVNRGPLCRCGKTREGHDQAEALVAPELRHPFEEDLTWRPKAELGTWRQVSLCHGIEPRIPQPTYDSRTPDCPVSLPDGFKPVSTRPLLRTLDAPSERTAQ